MAIADDRVGISQIAADAGSSSSSGSSNFNNISDSAQAGLDKVQGAFDKLQNGLSGVESKAKDILSNIPSIPNLNIDTSNLGMFDNILCGKLPGLNFRLPQLGLDFNMDWLDFDFTVCGKTQSLNPFDTLMSIADKVSDPKDFIGALKGDILGNMLDSHLGSLLKDFGLYGVPECLSDRTKWDLTNSRYGGYGPSLDDRYNLWNSLSKEGCAQNIMQMAGVPEYVKKSAMTNLLDSLAGTDTKTANGYFYNAYSRSEESRPYLLSSTSNMFYKNSTGSASSKIDYVASTLVDSTQSTDTVNKIINNTDKAGGSLIANNTIPGLNQSIGIKATDALYFRLDSKQMLDNMNKNVGDKDLDKINPTNMLLALNTMDPTWCKDEDGSTNVYKTKNNKVMTNVSNHFLTSNKPTLNLTGDVTTKLNLMHEVAIINSFKEDAVAV